MVMGLVMLACSLGATAVGALVAGALSAAASEAASPPRRRAKRQRGTRRPFLFSDRHPHRQRCGALSATDHPELSPSARKARTGCPIAAARDRHGLFRSFQRRVLPPTTSVILFLMGRLIDGEHAHIAQDGFALEILGPLPPGHRA
jgi:hypothetical protein